MAIFARHIKGCSENTASNETGTWSFLNWQDVDEQGWSTHKTNMNYTPTLVLRGQNSLESSKQINFGHLITENGNNVFEGDNTFKKPLKTHEIFFKDNTTPNPAEDIRVVREPKGLLYEYVETEDLINFTVNGNIYAEGNIHAEGDITSLAKCEALYFNATSDRRAKNSIQESNFNALDIVKALPIYNFNYNISNTPSIGIMAQDAAQYPLGDFNMVDNLSASGKDGDFMTVKESKLVYVLWKAVQELSAEVEELKAQLNK